MTDSTTLLIELHRNILRACTDCNVHPQDLCVMARTKTVEALRQLPDFPVMATASNDDIPEVAKSDGTFMSNIYVLRKADVSSYGVSLDEKPVDRALANMAALFPAPSAPPGAEAAPPPARAMVKAKRLTIADLDEDAALEAARALVGEVRGA